MKKSNWITLSKQAILLLFGAHFLGFAYAAVLGWAICSEKIMLDVGVIAAQFGQLAVLFLTAYLGGKCALKKKMPVAIGVGCGIVFTQSILRMFVFEGDVERISTDYLTFVVAVLAGGLVACMPPKRRRT